MVVLLMGVAGSGKTTIGSLLAEAMHASFCDADSLHSAANIAKMTRGEALNDEDRGPWLLRVRSRIDEAVSCGESLVVACSALKHGYRQVLLAAPRKPQLVYLRGSKTSIRERLRSRQGHFMNETLLDSQFATLEEPSPSEALIVDTATCPAQIVAEITEWLFRHA